MIVWAKQNGNWSDTTLWAFWNESTQQIEDYNQTPLADDVVYCNGHTINIVSGTYIISQIRNDVNPYTNIGGGFCKGPTTNSTIIFNAEIHSISKILSLSEQSSLGCYFTLIGDIYCRNEYAIHIGTNAGRCTINGNIYGNYAADVQWNPTLILNGNIYSENSALPIFYIRSLGGGSNVGSVTLNCNINDIFVFEINAQFRSLTINGNVTEDNYRMVNPTSNIISTLSISGDYTNRRAQYYAVTDFTIGGSIYYIGTGNILGVRYTNITILNPNTFVWKDVAEPRSNPFIILTNADMNNTDQYPSPANVKKDIPYAFNQMVGTYDINQYLPPETVVLKDYVYDNGEMVGTLDLPQAPTTSDIVTAIKNDSDLGGKINDITTNTENIKSDTENIISNTESIETNITVANNKINDITTNTENIKSDTENIISNTNIIKNIAEDIQISTNNILSESSSINNKSDSIITALNNTSPQIDDLWNRLNDVLTARLGQSVTVEILEEVLTSQLNNQ